MGIPAFPFCDIEVTAILPELKELQQPTTIAEHIRKRRIQLRMSQADVAKILNVSEDTVTYWENERSVPQIHHYPKLIEFLGCNPFDNGDASIGGQIKRYRITQGLSHRKLAKQTGFDPATLASWEENMTTPSTGDEMKLVIFGILK